MIGLLRELFGRPRMRSNSIDADFGSRILSGWINKGLSKLQLGQTLAVTAREMQQYEQGRRGMRLSSLPALSDALDVPVSDFFGSADGDRARTSVTRPQNADRVETSPDNTHEDPWEAEIARAFRSIKNPIIRDRVIDNFKMLRSRSADSQSPPR